MELDQLYLRKVTDAMAHNLVVINKLLGDEKRFPKKAVTDDDRIAQLLKEQIAAAATQQRKTLDLLNGALETEALGRMQNDLPAEVVSSDVTPKGALLPNPRAPSHLVLPFAAPCQARNCARFTTVRASSPLATRPTRLPGP